MQDGEDSLYFSTIKDKTDKCAYLKVTENVGQSRNKNEIKVIK